MKDILKLIDFPAEAQEKLLSVYETVKNTGDFLKICDMFKEKAGWEAIDTEIEKASQAASINRHEYNLAVLMANAYLMKENIREKGYPEEIFYENLKEFPSKLTECKKRYDVWGISAFSWSYNVIVANNIRLGRLDFVEREIKDGQKAIYVHIPSGGPLLHDEVIDSYKRAFKLFGRTHGDRTAFVCSSYLLFPDYQGTAFREGSNTYNFAKDYNILQVLYTDEFLDAWRVFYVDFNGDTSVLPKETSMQRAFIEYLSKGGKPGRGVGAFFFDGEKIYKEEASVLSGVVIP